LATPVFSHYSPDQVIAVWGPVILDGWGADSFISVTMAQDAFTKTVGVDGKVTRNKILDRSGRVEFTLMASSAANDLLSAAANLDWASSNGAAVAPISIIDHNGRLTFSAAEAWIAKTPDFEFAQETSEYVWAIDFARALTFVGGR
jgi:Protein of unknown function (DUF3277)